MPVPVTAARALVDALAPKIVDKVMTDLVDLMHQPPPLRDPEFPLKNIEDAIVGVAMALPPDERALIFADLYRTLDNVRVLGDKLHEYRSTKCKTLKKK